LGCSIGDDINSKSILEHNEKAILTLLELILEVTFIHPINLKEVPEILRLK